MNFLAAEARPGGRIAFAGIEIDNPTKSPLDSGSLQLGLRPEHLDENDGVGLEATVDIVEALGSTSYVHATLTTGEAVIAERRAFRDRIGDRITLRFAPHSIRLFANAGRRIR